mgnify:CR=1 FL=1
MPKIIAIAEVINKNENYTSNVRVNQHVSLSDEPLEKGGEDLGPAPGDYLCAALASCKAITLRMYVQRKKWDPATFYWLMTLGCKSGVHNPVSSAIFTIRKTHFTLFP